MDSLAYSVMLEIDTNTSGIDKGMQKSLKTVKDYHKQFQDTSKENIKTTDKLIDSHTSANKVLKEQVTIWGTITDSIAFAAFAVGALSSAIIDTVSDIATSIISNTSMAIMTAISAINTYVDDAMKSFDDITERYRFANIQAAGGVDLLHHSMTNLMKVTGASLKESEKIVMSLTDVGFNAEIMGKNFDSLSKTMWEFERITGVSAETSASLAKGMDGLGFTTKETNQAFKMFAQYQHMAMLTSSELTSVLSSLKDEMFQIEYVFGKDTILKYGKAMMELAGAAKLAGVPVEKAISLMRDLNNDPMKFIVALGGDALYKSADENMESLINRVDDMKASIEGVPPFLKPKLLKDLYGIDAATLKILESMSEFRKTNPALVEFQKILEKPNSALHKQYDLIRNKILAVFDKLAAALVNVKKEYLSLLKGIPEKINNLIEATFGLVNKILNQKAIDSWGNKFMGWLGGIATYFSSLIDTTTIFMDSLSSPENLKIIHEYLNDVGNILEKAYETTKKWAKSGWGSIEEAAGFVWDLMRDFAIWFDGWIANDGPQKLWKAISDVANITKDFLIKSVKLVIWFGGVLKNWVIDPIIWLIKQVISLTITTAKFITTFAKGIYDIGSWIYTYLIDPIMTVGGLIMDYIMLPFRIMGDVVILIIKEVYSHVSALFTKISGWFGTLMPMFKKIAIAAIIVMNPVIGAIGLAIVAGYKLGSALMGVMGGIGTSVRIAVLEMKRLALVMKNPLEIGIESPEQAAIKNKISNLRKYGHERDRTAAEYVGSGAWKKAQALKAKEAKAIGNQGGPITGLLDKFGDLIKGIKGIELNTGLSADLQKDRNEAAEKAAMKKVTEKSANSLTEGQFAAMGALRSIGQRVDGGKISRGRAIENRMRELQKLAKWQGTTFNREVELSKLTKDMAYIEKKDLENRLNKKVEEIAKPKDTKHSPMPVGAKEGAQSVHAAAKSTGGNKAQDITIDEDSIKKMGFSAEKQKQLIGLLEEIASNTEISSSQTRNSYSRSEKTANRW